MKTLKLLSGKLICKLYLYFCLIVFPLVLNTPYAKAQKFQSAESRSSEAYASRAKVKQVYTSQTGIREKSSNAGPHVEKYLRYVGLPKGNPWCAAFVCWVFGQAGVPNPRSGWSPDLFRERNVIWERFKLEPRTKKQESRRPQGGSYSSKLHAPLPSLVTGNWQQATEQRHNETPSPGDVFGLFFAEKNRIAHVGFIDHWDGTWLITVEGNTNIAGSREGDGVYRKRRLIKSIYKVARYVK